MSVYLYPEDDREERPPTKFNPNFFRRQPDGSVKLRLNLTSEEADLIELGAGKTPLLLYIHRVLQERAKFHISKNQESDDETEM